MSLSARIQLHLGDLHLDVELEVDQGEVVAVVGPNGAGKTSLLRALCGLQPLGAGRVVLDGAVLEDVAAGVRVPPERRPVSVVFQDYLLFPHLSAVENVAFGLRARGSHRRAAREEAGRWLAAVGAADVANRRPANMSGGQAQRVALARALASRPRLLLLDEPLSAVDVSARPDLRRLVRRQLREHPGIRMLVTHDPIDALTLADRLVVVEGGRVTQEGAVADVTARPRSTWVASLLGVNLLAGRSDGHHVSLDGGGGLTVAGAPPGAVHALVHPRTLTLHRQQPEGSARNVWSGRIAAIDMEHDRVRVLVHGSPSVVAEVTPAALTSLDLSEGSPVWVSLKATEVEVYEA